nr:MAG TPA: hypothetical protein [Caudoviricetes sp.]
MKLLFVSLNVQYFILVQVKIFRYFVYEALY